MQTPTGRFTAEPGTGGRHLCIAAGSGITPVLSIAASVLAASPAAHVTLIYGNRRAGHGDVRRRAVRPQGPLRPPASSWCTCCPGSRGTWTCSPAGWTPAGCVRCSTCWCRWRRSTTSGSAGRTRWSRRPGPCWPSSACRPSGCTGELFFVDEPPPPVEHAEALPTGETSEVTLTSTAAAAPRRCRGTGPSWTVPRRSAVRPAVRLQGRGVRHLPGAGQRGRASTCAATTRWRTARSRPASC